MNQNKLELRTNYLDDPDAKAAFMAFIKDIHGLDFAEWNDRGFWDPAFTPFSFFDGDRVVSSVCMYPQRTILNGRETSLLQISGVGTDPEFRLQGLNRELTETGLAWASGKHEGVFLFSDEEAIPYYEKQGFHSIDEFIHVITPEPRSLRKGAVRLIPDDERDLRRIQSFVEARVPVSQKFFMLNPRLVMFHVLYVVRNAIFEIPDLNCLVFCRRKGGVLSIYDIIGEQIPSFDELHPYLADPSDETIEFHFSTDRLGLAEVEKRVIQGNDPMVKAGFPILDPVFPSTSRA